MDSIKLSICVPTYNRANTLELLLESIYKQIGNHKSEVEICISDNASQDNTECVVQNYYEKLNINYYKQKQPIHAVLNWDYAIDKMPRGEYVLMVGDDDIIINNGIHRMIELITNYKSDYYYLNHIHAQIKVNYDKVYNNDCQIKYVQNDCECYNMESGYVSKWEEILNYQGKDQEVNMLFIGNHLMKRGMWSIDIHKFDKLYKENQGKVLGEDTIEYYYSIWSPQVTVVAQNMMGKRCYYYAEPIVSQGMGENTSDVYQILLLLFLPRWMDLFKTLNMDLKEYDKYSHFILQREVQRYVNLLLYKSALLEKYPFCANFIYNQGSTNENLKMISQMLMDKKIDYYYSMINNSFENELSRVMAKKEGKVVLWGTGDVAGNYIDSSVLLKDNIDYVVDGNVKLHGTVYSKLNLVIHNPEELKKEKVYLVIIASLKYEDEIKMTLRELQCKDYYIIGKEGLSVIV